MESVLAIIFWLVLLFIARQLINKSYRHTIKLSKTSPTFIEDIIDELHVLYEVRDNTNKIILTSPKFNDPITEGQLIIDKTPITKKDRIDLTYKREIKGIGYIIILISLLLCYIGVIVPIIIVKQNKKNVLYEIEKIRSLSKSIQ